MPRVPITEPFEPTSRGDMLGGDIGAAVAATQDQPEAPGLLAASWRSFDTTILGTVASQTIPNLVDSYLFSESDGFDPYAIATEEFLQSHPWLVKPYMNGTFDDFTNSGRFWSFEQRQRNDYENRQRLGQAGFVTQLAGDIIGASPEIILTAGASTMLSGIGKAGVGVASWVRSGGYMERAVKAATVGAATNLAYDQTQRLANPNRYVDEGLDQAMEVAGMGAAFGFAFHTIADAVGTGVDRLSQSNKRRMVTGITESLGLPDSKTLSESIAQQNEITLQGLKKPAWEVLPLDVFTPNEIEQIKSMGGEELTKLLGDVKKIGDGDAVDTTGLGATLARRLIGPSEPIVPSGVDVPATLGKDLMSRMLGPREATPPAPPSIMETLLGREATFPGTIKDSPLTQILAGKDVPTGVEPVVRPFAPTKQVPAHEGPSDLESLLAGKPVSTEVVPPARYFPTKSIIESDLDKLLRGESVRTEITPTPRPFEAKHAPRSAITPNDVTRIIENIRELRQESHMKAELQGLNFSGPENELVRTTTTSTPRSGPASSGPLHGGGAAVQVPNNPAQPVPAAPTVVMLLKDPANPAAYQKAIADAQALHGGNVVFEQHPDQFYIDHVHELDKLTKASRGVIDDFAMNLLGSTASKDAVTAVATKARSMYRALFDVTRASKEQFDDPLGNTTHVPGEGYRWQLDQVYDQTRGIIERARKDGLRSGGFAYTFQDGTTINFKRTTPSHHLERAIQQHLWMEDAINAGRRQRGSYNAPAPIVEAADALRAYYRKLGAEGADIGMLEKGTGGPNDHSFYDGSHRWNADEIRLRRDDLVRKLVKSQQENRRRDFFGGFNIVPDERAILPDVVNYNRKGMAEIVDAAGQTRFEGLTQSDRAKINALVDEQNANRTATTTAPPATLEDLTEKEIRAALGQPVLDRYLQEVELWHRGQAESFADNMLNPDNAHGVSQAVATPTKKRRIQIDPLDFGEFLDTNSSSVLDAYHHTMSGKIAARKGLRNWEAEFGPAIKERTRQEWSERAYDPKDAVQAVSDEFQDWIDYYVKKGDQNAAQATADAREKSLRIINAKLNDLQRAPTFPNNPSATVGVVPFLGKVALSGTYMAGMGKMAVSQAADGIYLVARRRIGQGQLGAASRFVEFLTTLPQHARETFYVHLSDRAKAFKAAEIGDLTGPSGRTNFGQGKVGRVLNRANTVVDAATEGFTRATGIRTVSTWLKNAAARQIQQEVIRGARLLVRADDLVKGGVSLQDALSRVGLSGEDAARLNRLGFNAGRSRRLLDHLRTHGLSSEGNPIANLDAHNGMVQPNLQMLRDRELFDVFNYAVNSEVQNLIVEPKILSRPLMNASWLGRAFNQFQTFGFAWGDQLLPLVLQSSRFEQARYFMAAIGAGIVVDALQNSLSGRRSLEDSARLITENPAAAIYGGILRSPVLGWLGRPVGLLEQTAAGPGKMLGNQSISTQYARPELTMGDFAGPVFGWMNNIVSGVSGSMLDDYNDSRQRRLWRALPFHNLWQIELLNRSIEAMGYDTPIGPEPIKR